MFLRDPLSISSKPKVDEIQFFERGKAVTVSAHSMESDLEMRADSLFDCFLLRKSLAVSVLSP